MKNTGNIFSGERIKQTRKQMGCSRDDFAKLLGVTSRFVAAIEVNEAGMSVETLKKLCQITGLPADFFLGLPDNQNIDPLRHSVINKIVKKSDKELEYILYMMESREKYLESLKPEPADELDTKPEKE